MMILTILGSLLIYVIKASVLSVSCSFDSCPSMCSGQACILYYIQDVGYTLNKCTDTCDGITSDNFSLQKCSNVKDVSNTKTCQNQCCYYHSLQKRQICLTSQSIGMSDKQYGDVCTRASRDLYKELDAMRIQLDVMKQTSSANEDKANNIAYAGLIVAIITTVSGIILTIYFKCKTEAKQQKQSNPETQRAKLQQNNIQYERREKDQFERNKKIYNKQIGSEPSERDGTGTKIGIKKQKKLGK